jgi:hypothetical protein
MNTLWKRTTAVYLYMLYWETSKGHRNPLDSTRDLFVANLTRNILNMENKTYSLTTKRNIFTYVIRENLVPISQQA